MLPSTERRDARTARQHPDRTARGPRSAGRGRRTDPGRPAVRRRADRGADGVRAVARGVQPGARRIRDQDADRHRPHASAFREAIDAVPTARPGSSSRACAPGCATRSGSTSGRSPAGSTTGRHRSPAGSRSELARRFDYVCVETPRLLAQHKMALTRSPARQSEGGRGAHGGHGRANVLGFTNSRALADLENGSAWPRERLDEAVAAVAKAERAPRLARRRARRVPARSDGLTWDQVDVASVRGGAGPLDRVIDEVTAGNPEIDDCRTRSDEARGAGRRTDRGRRPAKAHVETLGEALESRSSTRSTAPSRRSTTAEAVGRRRRARNSGEYLDALFASRTWTASAGAAARRARGVRRARCGRPPNGSAPTGEAATDDDRHGRGRAARTFETFLERWPNPNLGTDPDASYARLRPPPRRPGDQRPARAGDRVARQPAQAVRATT